MDIFLSCFRREMWKRWCEVFSRFKKIKKKDREFSFFIQYIFYAFNYKASINNSNEMLENFIQFRMLENSCLSHPLSKKDLIHTHTIISNPLLEFILHPQTRKLLRIEGSKFENMLYDA